MEQETIELVASLTGGKFSRKQIAEALKQSSQDPDDAIQLLLSQSQEQKMFSEKTLQKSNLATVMHGQQTKLKVAKANPKPTKLKNIESQLQSQDYFSRVLSLQTCENTEEQSSIAETVSLAREIFTNSTSREYCIMKSRIERERAGLDKVKAGGGLGLINLNERNAQARENPKLS